MKQLKKRLQIIAVLMIILSVVSLFAGCAGESTTTGGDTTEAPTTAPVNDETTAPVNDETTAPVEDGTTAPVEDETTAPVEDETTAPVEDETTAPDVDPTEPSVDPVTYKNVNGQVVLTWDGTTASYSNAYTMLTLDNLTPTLEDGVYTVTIENPVEDIVITFVIDENGVMTLTENDEEYELRVNGEGFETVVGGEELATIEVEGYSGEATWTATVTGKITVSGDIVYVEVYDEDAYNNWEPAFATLESSGTIEVVEGVTYIFLNAGDDDVTLTLSVYTGEDDGGNENDEPVIPTEEGKVTLYFTLSADSVEIPAWACPYITGGAWDWADWCVSGAEQFTNLEGTDIWYLITDKVTVGSGEYKILLNLAAAQGHGWRYESTVHVNGNASYTVEEDQQLVNLGEHGFTACPDDPATMDWYVIGIIDWGTGIPMTSVEEGIFESDWLDLEAGKEFKVYNGKWMSSDGGAESGKTNYVVETAGKYKVRFNRNTWEISLIPYEENTEPTIKDILDQAFALEVDASMEGEFELTGVITKFETMYGGSAYKITIAVEGDGREVLCYKVSGDYVKNLQVGDTMTVTSNEFKNYDGTIELNKCTLVSYTLAEGHEPVVRVEHEALVEDGNKLTFNVGGFGKLKNWSNGMQYKTVTIKDGLTVVIDCTAVGTYGENSGKFYLSDDGNDTWRLYASENVTFTLTSDKTIATIKVTYGVKQDESIERMTCNGVAYESGAVIEVNGNVVVLGATNTDEDSQLSAQVRIVEIEIVYADEETDETPAAGNQVNYDFKDLVVTGNELTGDTLLDALKAATTDESLVSAEGTKIAAGNSSNGGCHQKENGYLKSGTSSKAGQLVLTYATGTKVAKVEVYCQAWTETSGDTVSVNGSEAQAANATEIACLTFELTDESNVVTIDFAKRVLISQIVITFAE